MAANPHSSGLPTRLQVTLAPGAAFEPIARTNRDAEVALVLRRPDGQVWLMRKEYYPAGVWRIPTGGIRPDEPLMDATRRELWEETGWDSLHLHYLLQISYQFLLPGNRPRDFQTHAVLIPCGTATPSPRDLDERISGFRTLDVDQLLDVADALRLLPDEHLAGFGSWRDWGHFRAVLHAALPDALRKV